MDELSLQDVERLFTLKPNAVYSISKEGEAPTKYFDVYSFAIDEGIRYVELRFSGQEETVSVEEDFFFDFLENKNLVLHLIERI